MDWSSARDQVISHALETGWAAAGVAAVTPDPTARDRALQAIAAGRMDGMPWLSAARIEAAAALGARYPWARSILSLAWPYGPALPLSGEVAQAPSPPSQPRGRMAAYACLDEGGAADYHEVLGAACDELSGWLGELHPGVRTKRFVDHGWAMDRPIAERAGIGFAGKNTTLITAAAGSYVLLADMLTSLPFPPTPVSSKNCGSCQACLPSCPTGALLAPGVLDARRCISYLTIEHRGPIPIELRPLLGTWIFGCDLCMEACPINQRLAPGALTDPGGSTVAGPVPFPDLVECLELDAEAFADRFRGTAVWRTGRAGLARNAAIALGNAGDRAALPALHRAAVADPDEVVRESAAWAIARLESGALDHPSDLVEVVPAEQV